MILLTSLYKSEVRNHEFKLCIEKNCQLDIVKKYIIFFEGYSTEIKDSIEFQYLKDPKIKIIPIVSRPSYKTFIDFSNNHFNNEIVCVLNADVYFDDTINKITNVNLQNTFFCITRIHTSLKIHQNAGSQDAWIFKTPLKNFENDIKMGVLGCDSYIAQKARESGLVVKNPCLSINLFHVHNKGDPNSKSHTFLNGKCYWAEKDYKSLEIPYSEF